MATSRPNGFLSRSSPLHSAVDAIQHQHDTVLNITHPTASVTSSEQAETVQLLSSFPQTRHFPPSLGPFIPTCILPRGDLQCLLIKPQNNLKVFLMACLQVSRPFTFGFPAPQFPRQANMPNCTLLFKWPPDSDTRLYRLPTAAAMHCVCHCCKTIHPSTLPLK